MDAEKTSAYVPDTGVHETYANGLQSVMFDGANLLIELTVNRPAGAHGDTMTRHPVGRLVLPIQAAMELAGHINRVVSDLEERGAIHRRDLGAAGRPAS